MGERGLWVVLRNALVLTCARGGGAETGASESKALVVHGGVARGGVGGGGGYADFFPFMFPMLSYNDMQRAR